jgi:hypothetical protein
MPWSVLVTTNILSYSLVRLLDLLVDGTLCRVLYVKWYGYV